MRSTRYLMLAVVLILSATSATVASAKTASLEARFLDAVARCLRNEIDFQELEVRTARLWLNASKRGRVEIGSLLKTVEVFYTHREVGTDPRGFQNPDPLGDAAEARFPAEVKAFAKAHPDDRDVQLGALLVHEAGERAGWGDYDDIVNLAQTLARRYPGAAAPHQAMMSRVGGDADKALEHAVACLRSEASNTPCRAKYGLLIREYTSPRCNRSEVREGVRIYAAFNKKDPQYPRQLSARWFAENTPLVDSADLVSVTSTKDVFDRPLMRLRLSERSRKRLARPDLVGRFLAVVIGDDVMSVPNVKERLDLVSFMVEVAIERVCKRTHRLELPVKYQVGLVSDVELLDLQKAPSPAENAARYKAWLAALVEAAEATCNCKDMMCIQSARMKLRSVRFPTVPPTQAQVKKIRPHRKRLRDCAERFMKPMGRPVPPPKPKKAAPAPPAAKSKGKQGS